MAMLRLFAAAREAAGTGRDDVPGADRRRGARRGRAPLRPRLRRRARRRAGCGATATRPTATTPVGDDDEVAVLPPVSGGAEAEPGARGRPAGRAPSRRRARAGASPSSTTSSRPTSASASRGSSLVDGRPGPRHLRRGAGLRPRRRARRRTSAARCWRRPQAQPARPASSPPASPGAWRSRPRCPPAAIGPSCCVGVVLAPVPGLHRDRAPFVATAARTLQCALWLGGAAAGVVAPTGSSRGRRSALVLAVSAYETGDYLVGSGARNKFEGPVAGPSPRWSWCLTVAAVGPAAVRDRQRRCSSRLLAAVAVPAGQVVGSLVLPAAAAPAPARCAASTRCSCSPRRGPGSPAGSQSTT